MRAITAGFLSIVVCATACAAESAITREFLESAFFQKIDVAANPPPSLTLKFKPAARFLCTRNDDVPKPCGEGDIIALAPGDSFSLSESHLSLEFTSLPKPLTQEGWLVEFDTDSRSFGGKVSTTYGIILLLHARMPPELRFVEPSKDFDPKLPPTDPTYQRIVSLIAEANPLPTHELRAQSAGHEIAPPFPRSTSAIFFQWKEATAEANEVLEVRWIAENVRDAEKNHLIATTKSDEDKREGEFTLKKPTAGFPPGTYRIEIWRSGKMIYSEKFEIKGD
jgi:hypothetical protein